MDRNRLYLLGAAAVAAVAVVVVILIIVGTGGGSSGTTTTSAATGTTSTVKTPSLAGIPQNGDTLGRASAPVTLQVFEDPQCPYCRDWNVGTLPTVIKNYIRTGRINLVYRGIEIVGPDSDPGLRAAYAASLQNKLWQMIDELYARQGAENSGWITAELIRASARAAGADPAAVAANASSAAVTAMIKNARNAATAAAVGGTPTFVVQRAPALPSTLQLQGLDPTSFAAALEPFLK